MEYCKLLGLFSICFLGEPRSHEGKADTLREEILAGRNFGESAHSPISIQFGGINFGE